MLAPAHDDAVNTVACQAITASEQPGTPARHGILAQADRVIRSKAHTWLTELLPELEEKTAVSSSTSCLYSGVASY